MTNVRLVIWDLDNAFWHGALTEGNIQYSDANHAIVVELARRGIMSGICANNDMKAAVPILRKHGISEYFIFSDIGWGAKGPRVAALIQSVQLPPESVLFIDHNPTNLAEAAFFVPGLQCAEAWSIADMLRDARLVGEDDNRLIRLEEYKGLEAHITEQRPGGADNQAFLRASDIRVYIDYDIESNLEAVIELINRTIHLNFTKKRLPEEPRLARRDLLSVLRRYDAYAGLVRVKDQYTDHGFVGFFLLLGTREHAWAEHLCFSCRTANKGIETWMFRWLGRPGFDDVGEFLTDVVNDPTPIDWIKLDESFGPCDDAERSTLGRLVLRGGFELGGVSNYVANMAGELHMELHTARDNRQVRLDHSAFIPFAINGVGECETKALAELGYVPADWRSAMALPPSRDRPDAWVLSFPVDTFSTQYRHRVLDLVVPFYCPGDPLAYEDVTRLDMAFLERFIETDTQRSAIDALRRDWIACGLTDEDMLRTRIRCIADKVEPRTVVIILLGPERWTNSEDGETVFLAAEAQMNAWIRAEVGSHPNFVLLNVLDCVGGDLPRDGATHFDRMACWAIAGRIRRAILDRVTIPVRSDVAF